MESIKISAVIVTFNEEHNIERCLQSLQNVADEIVVVDSGSTDKTEEICICFGAKFVFQKWLGYGEQKNFANTLAQCDYILSLDADEALSDTLKKSILKVKGNNVADAYSMNRLTNFCGKKWIRHCGWYPDTKIRLWKKNRAEWSLDKVHEYLLLNAKTKTHFLNGDILHYTCDTISEQVAKENQYSDLMAKDKYEQGVKASIMKIIYKTIWRFVHSYFVRLGFLDGYYGFIVCNICAWGTFLKYVKLRQLHLDHKIRHQKSI